MMNTEQEKVNSFFGFILWLVWIAVAITVISGSIYLFVGGSIFFSNQNTAPIIAYKQLSNNIITLTGSIPLLNDCERLYLDSIGNEVLQTINFIIDTDDMCVSNSKQPVSETFFIEIEGNSNTEIRAMVNGINREIIIK